MSQSIIYLNNAATSWPKPEAVLRRLEGVLQAPPGLQERGGTAKADASGGPYTDPDTCRRTLADFFGAAVPDRFIFTSGATESLNTILFGMIPAGSRIVSTVIEHNSVLRPLRLLEKRGLIELVLIGCDREGYVDKEAFAAEVEGCSMAVVNHISNVTGAIQPLKEFSAAARKAGAVFVVDASQSAGVVPVDITRQGIDVLVFTGHKGLFGIQGSGGFYLSPHLECRPLKVGGTGVYSSLEEQPDEYPIRLEAGTRGLPGIISMEAGIQWIHREGQAVLAGRVDRLRRRALEELGRIPGLQIFAAAPGDSDRKAAGLFSFLIKGQSPEETVFILQESFDIRVRAGLHCAPRIHRALGTWPEGTVRVSFSPFNTDSDVDKLVQAVAAAEEIA
ncbi:MAG: aminotransferase class V-fold PLP-dependent enzyme [Spirochaetales bacterium]|nr:aminotransferase class V-fold PLP-dependent enzyme [Spirochaetales bacterium]MCF7939053.1 aminotransferase class V-fold PLP-dependent enzyme [Spirochaetales bacterium]